MPVVVMEPGVQSRRARSGTEVSLSVGPLSQAGLDKALGLTVGSGSKGLGAQVPDPQLLARIAEGMGDVGRAVVCDDALHGDAVTKAPPPPPAIISAEKVRPDEEILAKVASLWGARKPRSMRLGSGRRGRTRQPARVAV